MNELSASGAFISTRSMKDVVCVFFFVCILPFSVSSSKISSSRREKDEEHDKELARRSRSEDANVFNAFSSSSAHEKHTTPRTSFVFLFFFVENLSLVLLPLVVVVILEGEEERDEEEEEREETESDDTVDAVAVIDIIIVVVVVLFFLFSREAQTNSKSKVVRVRAEREREIIICAFFGVTLQSKAEERKRVLFRVCKKKKGKKRERRVRYHAEERERKTRKTREEERDICFQRHKIF